MTPEAREIAKDTLDQAGLAWCWGSNEFGTVGDGSITDRLQVDQGN